MPICQGRTGRAPLRQAATSRLHSGSSLAVLLLDVCGDVHEEGDRQEERLHYVGDVEVFTRVDLGELWVVDVEHEVAVEADAKEKEGEVRKLVGAERLEVADGIARHLAVLEHGGAWVVRQEALQLAH